ncbi:MAG: hypothetical protein LDL41_10415 [Coleofasciculus sp. S288]|nr:hypothetical protein [Coleofasciculus sp. S288]
MNLKNTSVCLGLIASSVLAFSATSAHANSNPYEDIELDLVNFSFASDEHLGTCNDNQRIDLTSCETQGIEQDISDVKITATGFKISGFQKRELKSLFSTTESTGLGIGNDKIDYSNKESIYLNLPNVIFFDQNNGSITLNSTTLTNLVLGDLFLNESISIEGFNSGQRVFSSKFKVTEQDDNSFFGLLKGVKPTKSRFDLSGEGGFFDFVNYFNSSAFDDLNFDSLKLTPKNGDFSLVSANTTITVSVPTPVPEPTPVAGMLGLLAGGLMYKSVNQLAKRQKPEL